MDCIKLRGAKENNLKDVNIDIPKGKLVVVSGVSGSGKSTLAFNTIYAEGQRRYMESLSTYARQFLQMQDKPDFDSIEGLAPTIAINQKVISKNPRSNVATITEIYDYMRLLYARIGIPYSPATGNPLRSYTSSQMVDDIFALPEGCKIHLMAPIVHGRKGEHRKELKCLQQVGYTRFKVDGKVYSDELPTLDRNKVHEICAVVDRLSIGDDIGTRLANSIDSALKLSDGVISVEIVGLQKGNEGGRKVGDIMVFSESCSCPESGFTLAEIEPRLFSFNSPYGACSSCGGLGSERALDTTLIVADDNLSIAEGAIVPMTSAKGEHYKILSQVMASLAAHYAFSVKTKWKELSQEVRDVIIHGSGSEKIEIRYNYDGNLRRVKERFKGIEHFINVSIGKSEQDSYYSFGPCGACNGLRLKQESLCVKVDKLNIGQALDLTIDDAVIWFSNLRNALSANHLKIAEKILNEVNNRLGFLQNVGLGYLKLSRASNTLSGGESQRIRLASQIGSGLSGIIYVLDEPSIGLHQCDNFLLLKMLRNLCNLGNSLLVVEHDEDTIRAADWVVEVGPGAGDYGGEITAFGTPQEIAANTNSITGDYLSGRRQILRGCDCRVSNSCIEIYGANLNNLKDIDVRFPVGVLTCVSGVSGGGKSSLVVHTLYNVVNDKLNHRKQRFKSFKDAKGIEYIDKIIKIDQMPIGRTPLSNPATYTGVFQHIRDWFACLPESKARGYKPGRFSFNVRGGRCNACSGDGVIKIEMHFLPDVYVKCDVCKGARYNRETLQITYKSKNITDILNMTVDEAVEFFAKFPIIHEKLACVQEVGLGYLHLGQYSTLLSGGEAQRIKLAKELSKKSTGNTLYVLDEPTTGLHMEDIKNLLKVLQKLVTRGNTMVVIEHNLHVIKVADHVIDIGPGSGEKGGFIVAAGAPEDIVNEPNSVTGKYLADYVSGHCTT